MNGGTAVVSFEPTLKTVLLIFILVGGGVSNDSWIVFKHSSIRVDEYYV